MKKFFQLLPLLVIPLFFGIFSHASATTLYSQNTSGTKSAVLSTASGGKFASFQKLGTGLAGTVASTTVYFETGGGLSSSHDSVAIQCYDDSAYATYNAGCSGSIASSVTIGASTGKTSYTFSTPLALSGTKYYAIGIGCTTSCPGGTNPDVFTYGTSVSVYVQGDFVAGYTIVDAYFVLTGSPAPLSFVTPTDGYNGQDFPAWVINPGTIAVNGDLYQVAYSRTNTTSTSCLTCIDQNGTHYTQFADSTGFKISGAPYAEFDNTVLGFTLSIDKLEALKLNTNYYAILTHFRSQNGGYTYLEQTSVITFTLNALNPEVYNTIDDYFFVASSTLSDIQNKYATQCSNASSSIPAIWATDGTIEAFGCMITRTAEFGINLFILPHAWTKGLLGQQWTEFKGVFPFSIFFNLTDTFLNNANNTSSTPALSVIYNWETPPLFSGGESGGAGASGHYPVLVASSTDSITFSNSNTLTSIIGRDQVIMIFNGIIILALASMMYVIYRMFFHQ